jgi:hypothetical protein
VRELAVDDTHVCWANRPEVFAAARTPIGVAANSRFVYWADAGTDSVRSKPKSGGEIRVIAQGEFYDGLVKADEDHVVFVFSFLEAPSANLGAISPRRRAAARRWTRTTCTSRRRARSVACRADHTIGPWHRL